MGAGKATGIILGVFFGILAIGYIFFVPYFHRRLVKNDARMRPWHIPLGPLLYRENPPIYFPGTGDQVVTDYYAKTSVETTNKDLEKAHMKDHVLGYTTPPHNTNDNAVLESGDGLSTAVDRSSASDAATERAPRGLSMPYTRGNSAAHIVSTKPEPRERWLDPVRDLPFYAPKKIINWTKYILLQGVSRDVVTQKSKNIPIQLND